MIVLCALTVQFTVGILTVLIFHHAVFLFNIVV